MGRLGVWLIGTLAIVVLVPAVGYRLVYGAQQPKQEPARINVAEAEKAAAEANPLLKQTDEDVLAKSSGCLSCHQGIEPMHESKTVKLGCTDCHGGCATASTKEAAHVAPKFPAAWPSSANPPRTFALLNNERREFIRFINPGDWRVTKLSCGTIGCHEKEDEINRKSIMGHSVMVPGSAFYNNGGIPGKNAYPFGEVYDENGKPMRIWSTPRATAEDTKKHGIVPYIDPVPRFEIVPPANIFRVLEINNFATSLRGVGTDFRVDAGGINVHKTKLNDPTMVFLGTNDHPGDYRSSGCTSCHVLYANDRDPLHSAEHAKHGNRGFYAGNDPTIPKNESGHPIRHQLTRAIPNSQCNTCHFHQGSGALANYEGYLWWDYEADMDQVYSRYGVPALSGSMGYVDILGSAVGGKQVDMHELAPTVNPQLHGNEFADFHNAGWLFTAVFKRDRHGNLLDDKDQIIAKDDKAWHKKAVHLTDVHLDKGMHCIDCHFKQDSHGNGRIYTDMISEIEVTCIDCHGTTTQAANFRTSNNAAPPGGTDLMATRTPYGERRFVRKGDRVYQRSSIDKGKEWEVVQIKDVITPGNAHYSEKARLAKTLQKDGVTWGTPPKDDSKLAHNPKGMTCYACHSAWNAQCSGCHLDARVDLKTRNLHYEGEYSKVYASYSPEVIRSEGYMIGINGSVQGNKVSPVRSASAVILSATDGNRATVNHQQPTIAAEGHSGHAMTPNPPHTVRTKDTKTCTDCHVSAANDNNALVSKVLGLGARAVDRIGRFTWVAEKGQGVEAVRVTAGEDFPQPVIGSDLNRWVECDSLNQLKKNHGQLWEAYGHHTRDARGLQRYGEWMLVADGSFGFRVLDIANVSNKNVAQRIVESPLSALGQNMRVRSKCATAVGLGSIVTVDTGRSHRAENEEPPLHPYFGYAYVTDFYEGLITINIHTLVDGNPSNNYLSRSATFNPNGVLDGAVAIKIAGPRAYICCKAGLAVVDISNPCAPQLITVLGDPALSCPRAIDIQFRYAFVCDSQGLKVVDITHPEALFLVASVPIMDARDVKVSRTYAYVAAGAEGIGIVDVETPDRPKLPYFFNADGCINDACAVALDSTYLSLYLHVADGHNGVRVLSLKQPSDGDDIKGFSPVPAPRLLSSYKTKGPAVAISEGMARDRYIDEDGNDFCVFGRRGSRGFNNRELRAMYLRNGQLYTVTDSPPSKPLDPQPATRPRTEE